VELNRSLGDSRLSDADYRARIRAAARTLQQLAGELLQRGQEEHPGLEGGALRTLLPATALLPVENSLLFPSADALMAEAA
jgi:hypothetical protein